MTRVPPGTVRTGAPLPGTGAGSGRWAASRHAGDHRLPAVSTTAPPMSVAMRRHVRPFVFTTARLPRTAFGTPFVGWARDLTAPLSCRVSSTNLAGDARRRAARDAPR